MDPDSSTGLNTSSDSASASYDYQAVNDFDSASKQSATSEAERTNIDALDDTARDTLIAPLEDSHSNHSAKYSNQSQPQPRLGLSVVSVAAALPDGALHDALDFEGGDEEDGLDGGHQHGIQTTSCDADADEDDDDGEIEDDDEEDEGVQVDDPDGEVDDDEDAEEGEAPKRERVKKIKNRDDEEEGELEESEDSEGEGGNGSGLEDGEVDDEPRKAKKKTMIKTKTVRALMEELEEGEVTDDEDRNKEPKAICRFFGKGQCTWGSNCRFLHPGVTDKGLYTMFDPMRPLPIPPLTHFPPMKTGLLGHAPPNFAPLIKLEEPVPESSWERGLRHAKEIIKQSVKRKETDVDFEEKKMNLSLGQEEIDKENDYYNRKSPKEPIEGDDDQFDDYNTGPPPPLIPGGPRDWPPPPLPHQPPHGSDPDFVRGERGHHLKPPGRGIREAPPRDAPIPIREAPPLHDPSDVRMVRESALRRSRFQENFRGPGGRGGGSRGFDDPRKAEEWHDPWARSPGHRKKRKDSSLSKRSSYSSGSSRSSSKSSISSKSSRSSRSSSSPSKSSKGSRGGRNSIKNENVVRKVAPPRRASPKPGKVRIAPPPPPQEEFGSGRHMGYGHGRGGPPPYQQRTRYAPPQQSQPPMRGNMKQGDERGPVHRNPGGMSGDRDRVDRNRDRGGRGMGGRGRGRSSGRNAKWSGSSRSRSRSRSITPYSKSSKSRSRSPRSTNTKRRSKFVRNRSNSLSRSRSPIGARRASWSRSKSRSLSSSSSRSSSIERKSHPRRKRPAAAMKDVKPSLDQMGHPPDKIIKLEGESRGRKSDSKPHVQSKSQIKLTLKSQQPYKANKTVLDKLADDIDAEDDSNSFKDSPPPDADDLDENSNSNGDGKDGASPRESRNAKIRRDELLKQLRAVEDAIAKKRSKLPN